MAKGWKHEPKKRRTREHVIADLSVNHVERHVLRSGHTVQRIERDYGIDLILFTYSDDGEVEPGHALLQLKASEQLRTLAKRQVIPWRLERADLLSWLNEPMPVFLVVYDADQDHSWWLYLQNYMGKRPQESLRFQRTATAHVPAGNFLNVAGMQQIVDIKRRIVAQAHGAIRHDE